jgi:hypothetical protein
MTWEFTYILSNNNNLFKEMIKSDNEFYVEAIESLLPNSIGKFSCSNSTILDWIDSRTQPTESEIQAEIVRLKAAWPLKILRKVRNLKLKQSDWWVLPDRTPTQAQLDYRQALRDLPTNSPNAAIDENGQLINVTWPTEPGA